MATKQTEQNDIDSDEEETGKIVEERETRREARKMQKTICDLTYNKKAEFSDISKSAIEELRDVNNELFTTGKINHSREQQTDALIIKDLAYGVKAQSAAMNDAVHNFDFDLLANNIARRCVGNFSWTTFGKEIGVVVTMVSPHQTMLGPIAKEMKARKATQRRAQKETGPAEKPIEIDQDEEDESTNERLNRLREAISDSVKNGHPQIDLLNLLIDKEDVVQTIENFFDFSFVVKVIYELLLCDFVYFLLYRCYALRTENTIMSV
jgi:hypothetical protein